MRDHGGNIDEAQARFGGTGWLDLSTGINRVPYPVPAFAPEVWTALPSRSDLASLLDVARGAYRTTAPMLAVAGAQAAIQLIPRLTAPGPARVLAPTYNEHAAALRATGWDVSEVAVLADLAGADLAVVVNPNNPDGRTHTPAELRALAARVGRLVVDESFADAQPELSLAAEAGEAGNLLVLRSFGKFYGLAGVRLGFVLGCAADIAALAEMAGPWPVSGAAIALGRVALADRSWAEATRGRLRADAMQMDTLGTAAGWRPAGGTDLFRLFDTPDAQAAQVRLARNQIWTRRFPYSKRWLRIGLPGGPEEWARTTAAFSQRIEKFIPAAKR